MWALSAGLSGFRSVNHPPLASGFAPLGFDLAIGTFRSNNGGGISGDTFAPLSLHVGLSNFRSASVKLNNQPPLVAWF